MTTALKRTNPGTMDTAKTILQQSAEVEEKEKIKLVRGFTVSRAVQLYTPSKGSDYTLF